MRHRFLHTFLMTVLLTWAVSTSALAQLGPPPTSNCDASTQPLAGQVIIYEHWQFGGACRVLGIGVYPWAGGSSWGNFGIGDNKISSLKMGPGTFLDVHADGEFNSGPFLHYRGTTKDHPDLFEWHDKISSLRVLPESLGDCLNPPAGHISIFQMADYLEFDGRWFGDCRVVPPGSYPNSYDFGLANDAISSIKFGPSTPPIDVCIHANFNGCMQLTQSIPNLGSFGPGNDINDVVSGIQVNW